MKKKKEKEKENENEITTNEIPISRCVEPLLSLSLSLRLAVAAVPPFFFFFFPAFPAASAVVSNSRRNVGGNGRETRGERKRGELSEVR